MCLRHLFRSRAADVAVSAAVSRVLRHWPSGCKLLSNSLRLNAGSTNGCFQITCFRTGPSGLPRTHVSGLQTRPEDGFDTQLTDRRRRRYADVHDALKLSPHDSQTRHGLSLQRDRTGLLRRSVHARATIWAPFAVIQASSACSVNSATKFFGMSGLPPEHDFQCGCPLLRRCGCFSFCIRHGIELRWICSASHRSRRSVNVASRQRS